MISTAARLNLIIVISIVLLAAVLGNLLFAPTYQAKAGEPRYCTKEPAELPLTAIAAYAEDVKTGEPLYEKNEQAQLPLASLTKVMTALAVSDLLPKGRTVIITGEALLPEGNGGLVENEQWNLEDLIDFTLMSSVNDGARALSLAAAAESGRDLDWFVGAMNERASKLGLSQTFFLNDTGLDVSSTTAGAYGSAKDIAHLLQYAAAKIPRVAEGSIAPSRTFVSLDQRVHDAKNTTDASTLLKGAIISKTGFTDLAGGNLGIVFEPFLGRPVALVILGSTREARETDIELLAQTAKSELRKKMLCEKFYTEQ